MINVSVSKCSSPKAYNMQGAVPPHGRLTGVAKEPSNKAVTTVTLDIALPGCICKLGQKWLRSRPIECETRSSESAQVTAIMSNSLLRLD